MQTPVKINAMFKDNITVYQQMYRQLSYKNVSQKSQ